MELQQGLQILNRVTHLDELISAELSDFTHKTAPAIHQLEQGLQNEVDALTTAVEQLGINFRGELTNRLSETMNDFSTSYIEPTQQAMGEIHELFDRLGQQVDDYLSQIVQPVEAIEGWTEGLGETLDELKSTVTGTIESEADRFIEATTDASDALLETLQLQLQRLAQLLEQWVNDLTGLADESLQQKLQEHTQTLTTQITDVINQLLNVLLERFDAYLQAAKQSLLDAVRQGSETRAMIEPALEQLEVVRKMIEEVVDQVKSLANKVGVPL